jgi:hypothetical protein
MMQTAYLETTIPSYLTAWRSNEIIMAANQQATRMNHQSSVHHLS